LSSFWLILKQQWTIKITSPLFLFWACRPSWLEVGITGHIYGRGTSKDHSTKVWFKLAQWLQRSWLKCEKLMDGRTDDRRRTLSGDFSSPGSGELTIECIGKKPCICVNSKVKVGFLTVDIFRLSVFSYMPLNVCWFSELSEFGINKITHGFL
jgi:hypothetical protein